MASTPSSAPRPATDAADTLHLARWTVTSGSNVNSRGAVVIAAGDHQWEAAAEGNGAVDALFRAVDRALADVLSGHPRLLGYDVHAVAEGPDAEGKVTLVLDAALVLKVYRSRCRKLGLPAPRVLGADRA